jgi:hypothetical protein
MSQNKFARLKTIRERQKPENVGPNYLASIFATPSEAPSKSSPKIIRSLTFGREFHVLSDPEFKAIFLAWYNKKVFEVQEQKMLSPWPALHPLVYIGDRTVDKSKLRLLQGTIDVANRLDALDLHAIVYFRDANGDRAQAPFPFIGDLLLFIRESDGQCYCINWNIKAKISAFEQSPFTRGAKNQERARRKARMRNLIEEVYYADAEIRTQRVAFDESNDLLFENLWTCWASAEEATDLNEYQNKMLIDAFCLAIEDRVPPLEVALSFYMTHNIDPIKSKDVFFGAIWNRDLRVDLFNPILFDYPAQAEKSDVLQYFSGWFEK